MGLWMGHVRVPSGLGIKTRLSAQPLIWKWFCILMQIKLIFTRKAVNFASFWKWGFLELGSGLLFGSFNNDDGDSNKNFKKVTICTCVTLFCTFLGRHCSLLRRHLFVLSWDGGGGGGGVGVDTQREPLRRREQSLLACSRRLDRGNGANRCGQTPGTGHVTARLGRENA